jgi:serine protease inhibitor
MEIREIFSSANFSPLFSDKGSFSVSTVLQKTFIDVDEHGTEAAAATVVEISCKN